MDSTLFGYIVTLSSGQKYHFWAEDENHAKEQAENAEPNDSVVAIEDLGTIYSENNPSASWNLPK